MDYESEKKSKFNAGVALAERIDQLQRVMNIARFNPLQPNPETLTMNYEVMIAANEGLFSEAWSKLNPDEKKIGEQISTTIKKYLQLFPPVSITDNGKQTINVKNYKNLLDLIYLFEKKNKEFLDNHNMNSPDMEDDEGL